MGVPKQREYLLKLLAGTGEKTPEGLIAPSVSEPRNLLSKSVKKTGETIEQSLRWSYWQRRHQYCA
ncbi:hypothetical protein PSI15_17385 [Xenorhabdus sp. PR6a]|uniref:hypothetical protein n=1 Tax=Xenorhabdus sp. PR6a TaxID=3025877 RepID=UPI00235A1D59|nr:hypothetical protein [Xenorhabdus sp. PR6a]MDC9583286.1 hypothetical protein [Xenorhabdus sp. PR6a]